MIRCSVEWAGYNLEATQILDEKFRREFNEFLITLPFDTESWQITIDDINKARDESKKPYERNKSMSNWHETKMTANYEQLVDLGKWGFKITPLNDETSVIVKLQNLVNGLSERVRGLENTEAMYHGAAAIIHVPDQSLMRVNETMLMEDACTDAIQDNLDAGWKILAICPPNAQRRPDYILGRHNPEHQINQGARRR